MNKQDKLNEFKTLFKNSKQSDYQNLMTQMEKEFNIPYLKDEIYNKENKEIIELYLEISNARNI